MSYQEQVNTYIIFVKTDETGFKTIKVKATGFVVSSDVKTIRFDNGDKSVGIFNMDAITGFVKSDSVEN